VVSTSNPTAAFSAFQIGPLLLYSSNYSVYHEAEWTQFQTQLPQKNPKECPGMEPWTSVFVVCNANHMMDIYIQIKTYTAKIIVLILVMTTDTTSSFLTIFPGECFQTGYDRFFLSHPCT
jgi:hypothetical protein